MDQLIGGGKPGCRQTRRRPRRRPGEGHHHRLVPRRRARRLDAAAGHRRFLGAVVRPVQAARPDPRKGGEGRARRGPLVKINIDENQELAQQMRIQSIPAVYAFKQGRPVDGFVGAPPESQIKQFVQKLALGGGRGGPVADRRGDGAWPRRRCKDGDHDSAAAIYSQVLQHEPDNAEAIAGLARALIARGELDQAQAVPQPGAGGDGQRMPRSPRRARRSIWPSRARRRPASRRQLRARLDAEPGRSRGALRPGDGAVRRRRARGRRSTNCWTSIQARPRLERTGGAQAALKFFEAMGPTDPLTLSARRRLSSLMFS